MCENKGADTLVMVQHKNMTDDEEREEGVGHHKGLVVKKEVVSRIPTAKGVYDLALYSNNKDDKEHLVICIGGIDNIKSQEVVDVRIHSECFTGDVLGSLRCDCGEQLQTALAHVCNKGFGVVLYLRQEGRGIGLKEKLKAYNLQDNGYDTVEANVVLGHLPDERNYDVACRICEDLELKNINLLTNNPLKIQAMKSGGLHVENIVSMFPTIVSDETVKYLSTKILRMNHHLDLDSVASTSRISAQSSSRGSESDSNTSIVSNSSVFEVFNDNNVIVGHVNSGIGSSNSSNNVVQKKSNNRNYFRHIYGPILRSRKRVIEEQKPFVTLTYAQSMDGSIASKDRKPLRISGEKSMRMTHELRARHDCIVIGIGTVLSDNPQLTIRFGVKAKRPPVPVVLDTNLKFNVKCRLAQRNPIIICGPDTDPERQTKIQELQNVGIRVLCNKLDKNGRIDLKTAMESLYKEYNMHRIMVEGGASVITNFLSSNVADACIITVAHTYIGGLRAFENIDEKTQMSMPRLTNVANYLVEPDTIITGFPTKIA